MEPVIADEAEDSNAENETTDNERTDGEDSVATPSQSRSPSVHPVAEEDTVDVFDGYSFKGRHSVILDDDDEQGDGDESGDDEEEESQDEEDFDYSQHAASTSEVNEMETVDEVPEPSTPEAKPAALPEEPEAQAVVPTPVEAKAPATPEPAVPPKDVPAESSVSEQTEQAEEPVTPVTRTPAPPPPAEAAPVPPMPAKQETIIVKPPVPRPTVKGRNRREKSGIPALDRNIADTNDEDGLNTERDEDDDDWDFVETNVDEERNGPKGAGLFTRGGVVDRYRLTVFRKSTPRRSGGRNFSARSIESDMAAAPEISSPTPSEKQRRGRNPGLTFRRNPKEFLRAKSPPPSATSSKSRIQSAVASLSAASTTSTAGPITPSHSMSSSLAMSPSLKSKESAVSVGSPSESSDQSVNGEGALLNGAVDPPRGASMVSIEEKQKSKVLKKYKEGAEKVLSIFQSPR